MTHVFKTGEHVRVRAIGLSGPWTPASIRLASSHGRSLVLSFEGSVRTVTGGTYIRLLPLLVSHDLDKIEDLAGHEFEIERITK